MDKNNYLLDILNMYALLHNDHKIIFCTYILESFKLSIFLFRDSTWVKIIEKSSMLLNIIVDVQVEKKIIFKKIIIQTNSNIALMLNPSNSAKKLDATKLQVYNIVSSNKVISQV